MPTGAEADVLRADDNRFEAMRKGDWNALDMALADDLTYVHSTARLETKAEHIANLKGGKPQGLGLGPLVGLNGTDFVAHAATVAERRKPPYRINGTGVFSIIVRRRPTLPQGPPCSTIGAERLSFRVRNVTGRFPNAMTTETL